MNIVTELAKRFHNTFFNLNSNELPANAHVDVRDLGMVARYNRQYNPQDGWGLFMLEQVNAQTKAHDAFKVTEEGYTYFEVRLSDAIQTFFRERTELIVTRETIVKMISEAHEKANYYSYLADLCMKYESAKMPHLTPLFPITRTFN